MKRLNSIFFVRFSHEFLKSTLTHTYDLRRKPGKYSVRIFINKVTTLIFSLYSALIISARKIIHCISSDEIFQRVSYSFPCSAVIYQKCLQCKINVTIYIDYSSIDVYNYLIEFSDINIQYNSYYEQQINTKRWCSNSILWLARQVNRKQR